MIREAEPPLRHPRTWRDLRVTMTGVGLSVGVPPCRGLRPGPQQPSAWGRNSVKPFAFETLDGLARHLHRLRRGQGIQITGPQVATWCGSDTFPVLTVYELDAGGAEHWLCAVAIQGRPREALEAALARTHTDIPEAA